MRRLWLGVLLLAVESLAFGQLDSDTLTVSASQSYILQLDQLIFLIHVTTPVSTGLDEVVASLKSAGITTATLSSLSSSPDRFTLSWLFTLGVPVSKVAATVAQLTAKKIDFLVQGSQVSPESQQAQKCPVAIMMADARAQAKRIADAAELVVGEVLALSGGAPPQGTQVLYVQQQQRSRAVLDPTSGTSSSAVQILIPPPIPTSCSLKVTFKLLRYHY